MAAQAKGSSARGGHTGAASLSRVVSVFESEGRQSDNLENPRVSGSGGRLADFAAFARRTALWMADAVAGVMFPGECRLCDGLLATASRVPVCEACLAGFEPLGPRICAV